MRRFAGAVAAVAALTLAVPVAVAAPGAPQQAAATGTTITLLDRTAWVGDGLDFVLSARLDGAPAGATVRLAVHDRVTSRSEFARSVDGEGLRSERYRSADVPLTEIDPDADGVITVAVPLVDREGVNGANITRAGVYPVELEVRDPAAPAAAVVVATLHTHLVRLPAFDADAEALPLDTVVVLPIGAAPTHVGTDPPAVPDAPIAEIAAALAAHPDVPVTVAPTPETIAAAAANDPGAVDALALALAGREVLPGPWVDLDEAAWARADAGELDRQLDRGRQALVATLDTEPSGVRLAPTGSATADLATMAGHGTGAVVVEEADLEPVDVGDFPFTVTRPFAIALEADDPGGARDGGRITALGADAALEAHAATAAVDPVLAAHLVLADLAVLASDQPALQRVATLVLPPVAARSPAFLEALLAGLEPPAAPPAPTPPPADPTADPADPAGAGQGVVASIPAAAPVLVARTTSQALTDVAPAGADGEPDPDDPLVRRAVEAATGADVGSVARAVAAVRDDLTSARSVFGPADPLLDVLDLVVATAPAAALAPDARTAALDGAGAAMAAQLAGLHPPDRQTVSLTAREGRIQLVLTNDTGRPAQVTLQLRADRLVLPDAPDGRLPVRLTEASTRIDLRVVARSSGDTTLDVVLSTPDERIELGQTRIVVRATAVSGVGVVLLGGSALFLVLWWTRTIVRERRGAKSRHPAHAKGRHAAQT